MRLMAPMLSFTADEIWHTLNLGENKSVFEDVWYKLPDHELEINRTAAWFAIVNMRSDAAKEIELLRSAGQVGSSLQAELEFYVAHDRFKALESLGDDLKFVTITSSAKVFKVKTDSEQKILVKPSAHKKCERCWHYVASVGIDKEHPTICGRCVSNLFGAGEARKYA
jgi:isoleucyl-tRNA synthetase